MGGGVWLGMGTIPGDASPWWTPGVGRACPGRACCSPHCRSTRNHGCRGAGHPRGTTVGVRTRRPARSP
eukprot:6136862-Lingulodinium_polyedra.AAC.1